MLFTSPKASRPESIPASAGIGLRAEHYREILESRPAIGWLEVHSENYFGGGGAPLYYLERIRESYPLSFHGVGLSLGSTDPLSTRHLDRLKDLIRRFQPGLVSEHLSWSSVGGRYLNDLLPLPDTEEALTHLVARIDRVQEHLGRPILIENISSYLQYRESTIPEWEFVAEVSARSGCGILLDVNNVYVSAKNHGFDASAYLRGLPESAIGEVHLAGFTVNAYDGGRILIDTHNRRVAPEVWNLYVEAVHLFGAKPTLIEWDANIPPLAMLLVEAGKAQRIMEDGYVRVA